MDKPTLNLQQIIAKINSGEQWSNNALGFSFATSPPTGGFSGGETTGISVFSDQQKDATRRAMELWSDLIDIQFFEVTQDNADILLSNYTDAGVAYAYFPTIGDIFVNPNNESNTELEYGDYGFATLIHEIGHALGLDHPGNYNAGDGNLSYQNNAEYQQDSNQYSIMSYWEASNTGADHGALSSSTPLLHDIATIQAIYGANTHTRTGDTVYGFNSTADRAVYQFNSNAAAVFAIWDSAGNDTLDASGYSQNALIRLAPGSFSSIGGLSDNIAIAFGSDIENAIGGDGHDLLSGQAQANILSGGNGNDTLQGAGGNDILNGGEGSDTAIFSGDINQYKISQSSQTHYQISGVDGLDALSDIEILRFDNADDFSLAQAISSTQLSDTNNSIGTAATITTWDTVVSRIGGSDHYDLYTYRALDNTELDIRITDSAQPVQLKIYDAQLKLLRSTEQNFIIQPLSKDQSYLIELSSTSTSENNYTLTTRIQDSEIQTQVILLSIGLFNAAPSADVFSDFYNTLTADNDLDALVDILGTSALFNSLYDSALSDIDFAQLFIEKLIENEVGSAEKAAASHWVAANIEAGTSRTSTMIDTLQALLQFDDNDVNWGDAHLALTHKINVAKWYAIDENTPFSSFENLQGIIASVTSDPNSVTAITGIAAPTSILTTGINALPTAYDAYG